MMRLRTIPCFLPLAMLAFAPIAAKQSPGEWIEGDQYTESSLKPNVAGWGRKELLSEQKWAQFSTDDKSVQQVSVKYDFQAKTAGQHDVWIRLGYEFVRSPFRWRIDSGPWSDSKPEDLTTDLMPIDLWVEVAWLKLGKVDLTAGKHVLEFEILPRRDDKGQPNGILFACDAILITPQPFRPNGPNKPGENPQSADDLAAASQTFQMKPGPEGKRTVLPLNGLWQVARDDEQLPGPVAEPIAKLPQDPIWSAIPVPSDRNVSRPDLMFAHRFWYRTRLQLPDQIQGKSFVIRFPQNCLNTTVYLNGELCGFEKSPYVGFQVDLTKAAKPGVNELMVGIRDAWYGYSASPTDPMKLRRRFNLPLEVTKGGFQDLAYPVWGAFYSGILETPVLVCTGKAYADDVFVKPSVAKKEVAVEVVVKGGDGTVRCDVLEPASGQIVASLGSVEAKQDETVEVAGKWDNPTLWWPDNPKMYTLRTTVSVGGQTVDTQETPFGFREWTTSGRDYLLNGVRWPGWGELIEADTPQAFVERYRAAGQRLMRVAGVAQGGGYRWKGLPMEDALSFLDQNGVVVRRSGIVDGEVIGYMAVENDPELKKLYNSEIKMELMRNWTDQMVGQVRNERNHPSIHLWSIENEFLYINCINLYGGLMDEFEREVGKIGEAVRKADPTRLWMVDGGGAAKDNSYPVHGDHYVYTNDPSAYPNLAYQPFVTGGGRGRWVWDQNRPRYLGEDFFATGINPADYAWIAGEEAFGGKTSAHRGIMLVQRMLTEGYRWANQYSHWHLWVGSEGSEFGKWISNAERAVLCREYDWTFGSGQEVARSLRVFNDSQLANSVTLTATLSVGGKKVDTIAKSFDLKPGSFADFPVKIKLPSVAMRTEGTWELTLQDSGTTIFQDTKPLAVLPSSSSLDPALKAILPSGTLAVFDPGGRVVAWLKAHGLAPTVLASLANVPKTAKVLVVGPDALDATQATQPTLAAAALGGLKVVVLDQGNPLKFQALPVDIESTQRSGAFAFIENPTHPVFDGLKDPDFRAWTADGNTFRAAYRKPEKGARSLAQCLDRLGYSALVEVPVGQGLLMLSQFEVGKNLGRSATASRLLGNLLLYAASYKLEPVPVASWAGPNRQLAAALDAIGVRHTPVGSVLQAIDPPQKRIAVVSGDAATLKSLADQPAKLKAFYDAGGTLVVNGLTADGLASYNKIVGVPHMIRPFRRDKSGWAAPRDPSAVGIGTGDIVMLSSERLFEWTSDVWIANDIFASCVDTGDVAPFAQLPSGYENIVNGMVSSDGWKYIFSFGLPDMKPEVEFKFPKPMEFTEMEWIGNGFYHLVTKIDLVFDGKEKVTFDVKPNTEPQMLTIAPPRKAQSVLLRIVDWQRVASASQNVVGIDNVRFWVKRDPAVWSKVHPVDVNGGIVRYSIGKGGVLLANMLFQQAESVPINAAKKRNILAGLLRNLGASFAGGKMVIAGASGNVYKPIEISAKANQYRNQRGWFGDANRTFADLPSGQQIFAGVPFEVFEFKTSPVPNAIMLGGPGVPNNLPDKVEGVPVGRKASALFFLQAARVDQPVQDWERRDGKKFVVAKYIVHYADGQTVEIPWVLGENVANFVQKRPEALPGAALAWSKPYANSDESAVAYVLQWNNPRPDATIASFDLVYGPDRRAVPVVLAVTAVE